MKTIPLVSAAGFVLAGGQSSRMGRDKALVLFGDIPLIQVALANFAAAGIAARIAGTRSSLAAYGEEIRDTFVGTGPMGGIHAGLSTLNAEWSLFLPVDLPLMPPSLLACLLQRAALTGSSVTATRFNGRLEPFPVVLHKSVLPSIAKRLEGGETACHRAWQTISAELGAHLDAVDVECIIQCGHCSHPCGLPPVFWYQSANSQVELARLDRIHAKLHSPLATLLK